MTQRDLAQDAEDGLRRLGPRWTRGVALSDDGQHVVVTLTPTQALMICDAVYEEED